MDFYSDMLGEVKGWKPDRREYSNALPALRNIYCLPLRKLLVCNSVDSAADQPYDYVFVTTKAIPDVLKTSEVLSPLLTPSYSQEYGQPTYILLQNGLSVELDLSLTLGSLLGSSKSKIISAAVYILTNLLKPNVVEHGNFVSSSELNIPNDGV